MKPKTIFYKNGWWTVMRKLTVLRYSLDRQIWVESMYEKLKVYLKNPTVDPDEHEYAVGMMAAIDLFEKTGIVPLDISELN